MVNIPVKFASFKELMRGHPQQLRTVIETSELNRLSTGSYVRVACEGASITTTLVSEPLVIANHPGTQRKEVALHVRYGDDNEQ